MYKSTNITIPFSASTEKFERDVNILVNYNGSVHYYPHRIFYSTCSIDVKDFPFDNQTCHLWFGSWTHKVDEVKDCHSLTMNRGHSPRLVDIIFYVDYIHTD